MTSYIQTNMLPLFQILDEKLVELLMPLTDEEWQAQTVARLWKVKDVASHLLDGNLRGLSISRDHFFGEKTENINSYQDLVSFLNTLNLTWTNATKRLSPKVLIELLSITGKQYIEHLQTLNPFDNAIFSVAWAGQDTSQNWFHIAREYTEKFLHQQQIRDALNMPGIMTKELFYPFLDTLMHALPYTFKNIEAPNGTMVTLEVSTDIGGAWHIIKDDTGWQLNNSNVQNPDSKVTIDPVTSWKLFSKSLAPEQIIHRVKFEGNRLLGEQTLKMVAVMA